jgi:F0F1-type ATP synthase membrane subunit c/vacuolar-type H+-ATPase subunit K
MNYLIWKLHRNQVRVAIAALLILAVVLITSGIHMSRVYRAALVACAGNGACSDLQNTLFQGDGLILDLVLATLVIPFLLGMFWGLDTVNN